jgi:hypothetical protein
MLPSPADSGEDRPGGLDRPSSDGGLMAAPVADAFAIAPQVPAQLSVRSGGCFARPLPLDGSCAGAARRFFREAVAGMGMPGDLIHDGITMASELAANTMHAQGNVEFGSNRLRPVTGFPELWIYLRGTGARCELVCKVYDSQPGWRTGDLYTGELPDPTKHALEGVNGRGLQVVNGLSAGQWGYHPTRARLGSWKVPGKAVWFSLRLPPACDVVRSGRPRMTVGRAVDELEAMLTGRGIGGRMVRADEPTADMAVLSVRRDLTVWLRSCSVSWRKPDGSYARQQLSDLVDVEEQIVCTHEELDVAGTRA